MESNIIPITEEAQTKLQILILILIFLFFSDGRF
jgi:hypothetical protein